MSNIEWFLLGILIGGTIGTICVAALIAGREERNEWSEKGYEEASE